MHVPNKAIYVKSRAKNGLKQAKAKCCYIATLHGFAAQLPKMLMPCQY